jgi:hypothetical protein
VIKYRLKCGRAHEFEAWFPSSASFEAQAGSGQVCCPDCGGRDVVKAIMAPNVVAGGARGPENTGPAQTKQARLTGVLRELRHSLLAEVEDVGSRFPEEARRIHYGEAHAREICGTASGEDAQALLEEGIEILAIPRLPEDVN